MLLYLAGLKGVDPSLREAAAVDGASEIKTFFRIVFPVMRPINIIVVVITVIESLRAFDLAFITNKGLNGLELLSTLVTNNIIGETSRIGFGSAIAVVLLVISVGPIIFYLFRALGEENE
jgi:multiple sugar transport system permease protein/raffinose/stachyose/melibiose transport system permease protein